MKSDSRQLSRNEGDSDWTGWLTGDFIFKSSSLFARLSCVFWFPGPSLHRHGYRPPPPPVGSNFNALLPLTGAAVAGGLAGFGLDTFLNGNGRKEKLIFVSTIFFPNVYKNIKIKNITLMLILPCPGLLRQNNPEGSQQRRSQIWPNYWQRRQEGHSTLGLTWCSSRQVGWGSRGWTGSRRYWLPSG